MPLKEYGVLKGRAIASRLGAGQSPHYQVHIIDNTIEYRIAVNVKSKLSPSELGYLVDESFTHPITSFLQSLDLGFHELSDAPDSGAIDFIRGNLFDATQMKPLPYSVPGPDNDLNEKIDAFVSRAIQDELATVYAFGERWGPEPQTRDKYFGFLPGNGIHDIHMNQGNTGRFQSDNGVWQDGALILHFPAITDLDGDELFAERWVGVFLAFQSQVWHTDDRTGDALPGFAPGLPGRTPVDPDQPSKDGRLRIVAALVNPAGDDPGHETVTLINTTPEPVDLSGWMLADKHKKKMTLPQLQLEAGDTAQIRLSGNDVQLSNKGGLISLLDPNGIKVHGVAYTQAQVRKQGETIVF